MTEINPDWDVFRDENGVPVTITPQQFGAISHALRVVGEVRRSEDPDAKEMRILDAQKSRLLGRMLVDGRPPLAEKPPEYLGAPGYHLVEPNQNHFYLKMTPQLYKVNVE